MKPNKSLTITLCSSTPLERIAGRKSACAGFKANLVLGMSLSISACLASKTLSLTSDKATRLRTNCQYVAQQMSCRCDGMHEHQTLEGQAKVGGRWVNRMAVAQVYPAGFVDATLTCVRKSVRQRERDSLERSPRQRETASDTKAVGEC